MTLHHLYSSYEVETARAVRMVAARLRMTSDEAEDFAQEALLYLLEHENVFAAYAGKSKVESYLFPILFRFALRRRSHNAPWLVSDSLLAGRSLVQVPSAAPQPDAEVLARRVCLAVRAALLQLPPEMRSAIRDRFLFGTELRSLADTLGTSSKTIYRRWDRARATLQAAVIAAGVSRTDVVEVLKALSTGALHLDTYVDLWIDGG